ncbi:carbohydrate kinase family protein [Uliginosibacterium sp. 31-16]|uniref:carbohydrate kinase family protein n=1 Tax=Uliginosibacterium sp. 31-16 TaxID=3068315 RepID=UPI00273D86F0|nr:carbohydrate kinase family protein [Uliginosibacterium sp. 31-16]MDP5238434.1 carbohydrate kinase family protein [Uliginosibacterium sp. 31-16]
MSVLICGSMAYDTIMVFHSQFKRHILPEQIHILNVSFLVPEMRRDFGGCAGNIAWSLKLLGGDPQIMATVGDDAGPYLSRLEKLGISTRYIREIGDTFTAQAFITTDLDDNQITAFHPGAMSYSHKNHVRDADGIKLGIVSPDGRDGMFQHAHGFAAAGLPFIFDPGQGLPMFSGPELLECIDLATYCTLNDYEARMVCEKTGLSLEVLAERLQGLIVTLGAQGSRIYTEGRVIEVATPPANEIVDPTGCGDAYRGGLLYGLSHGWTLEKSAQLASVMGSIKIAHRGGQNYSPSRDDIAARFAAAFGAQPW